MIHESLIKKGFHTRYAQCDARSDYKSPPVVASSSSSDPQRKGKGKRGKKIKVGSVVRGKFGELKENAQGGHSRRLEKELLVCS